MIPEQNDINLAMKLGIEEKISATKTYRMHVNSKRIYGNIDGKEALKQMIYKNLNTEYGVHLIYPTFGIELQDLFGKPKNFAYVELIRRIEECLIRDDRINSVTDFKYIKEKSYKDNLSISFVVNSIYGDIEITNDWKFDYDNID
ncbi:Protein of unknown function [Peptoniphilus asaccharolyticus DSM 20463]|uniref:Uncharacterized protein n=1 Tax=Peptoniphilus asaccharolyticus DSM 20463 TaxID=573058 RepID=A0A1W1V190_PEPAS|nr:DUF2634 domain-containing protein [Peptoniphilus asaccharolyticus]MBL7575512.1 DUF2634 domain-containing protein [Peptoniphilus asaccharolyticus]SMB87093.1 Protein of unknown function [Peptoniphilus asaccharolyticus DSM 20463]